MLSATEIGQRLHARNSNDRTHAWTLLILAVPFTLFSLGAVSALLAMIVIALRALGLQTIDLWGQGRFWLLAGATVILLIDVLRHPSESWYRTRYYLMNGSTRGHEFGLTGLRSPFSPENLPLTLAIEDRKGIFSGMPLMTNLSDPRNWTSWSAGLTNSISNLVLGGPRRIREGIELLSEIRSRSALDVVDSCTRFLSVLRSKDGMSEEDLSSLLEAQPGLQRGSLLADELDLLGRRLQVGQETIFLRPSSSSSPTGTEAD